MVDKLSISEYTIHIRMIERNRYTTFKVKAFSREQAHAILRETIDPVYEIFWSPCTCPGKPLRCADIIVCEILQYEQRCKIDFRRAAEDAWGMPHGTQWRRRS